MEGTMIQQVMTAPKKIEFRSIPIPTPCANQVLVKVMKIGICGSDIHVYHGTHPFTSYPITQGHELSAKVVELGSNVTEFNVGQKVTVEPQVYCGKCYPCRHGKYNLCEDLKVMGFQTTGTASEYFAVDASKVTPLPENLTYNEGAMIEPLAVSVHAVRRFDKIKGAKIAILGAGPIGILLAQAAKGVGAERVLITDVSNKRLDLAQTVGVDYTVNTLNVDFGDAMKDAFGPDKADVIYDCAGNDITMEQAIKYARKGSKIVLVAVFDKKATVDFAVLNDHELNLDTSMMYRHEDYVEAIRLVNEGKIQMKPLMSRHFSFQEYLSAYKYIDNNRESTLKVLIDIDNSEE